MEDVFLSYLRETIPDEESSSLIAPLTNLENGQFKAILEDNLTQILVGHQENELTKDVSRSEYPVWTDYISRRVGLLLNNMDSRESVTEHSFNYRLHLLFLVGVASLYSFLQANVTGPPLPFSPVKLLLPLEIADDQKAISVLHQQLIASLTVDGEAVYKLTPYVELLCLANAIFTSPLVSKNVKAVSWAKLRVDFQHQRLFSDISPTLQTSIFEQLQHLDQELLGEEFKSDSEISIQYLLEKATIHIHHGSDKIARKILDQAARKRKFDFALTGKLGKRTKYQERDISQLVVLARSASNEKDIVDLPKVNFPARGKEKNQKIDLLPENIPLHDDTLLEAVLFSKEKPSPVDIRSENALSESLRSLDPSDQPMLDPLDSIVLLLLASSITNSNPSHGLTREETFPYATRVLDSGSSNWQVYTQALLVRSRIEGYKSRTMERGLLQLQALVDQVIADTTSNDSGSSSTATTFLPKPKEDESATISDRLRYAFQLCSPSRWELEAELAARWVNMGGLRTALEIYQRLEMWTEAALCLAATEQEDKARKILRKQLFHSTSSNDDVNSDTETWMGQPRNPPPPEAPRLYCILGDIDKDPAMYEKAWEVSNQRYARAQRSLGKHYYSLKDYRNAAHAYSKSLEFNQLNQSSWFALGCALLELSLFRRAVEAFSRAVQLDDTDAEAWSNLAAALLHLEPGEESDSTSAQKTFDDESSYPTSRIDPQQYKKDSLKALHRAATLKFDNYQIWDNVLTVAASLVPPSYNDIVVAQRRVIEIRGKIDGEKCIDVDILEKLVHHILSDGTNSEDYDPSKPGLARMVVDMMDRAVVPLITANRRLWQLVARLMLWRKMPSSALEAYEKAWRAITNQPGWEYGTETRWNEVVDATIDLVDAYKNLGQMERTEGLGSGQGELVAKDWKFKGRSAIRGIISKGKVNWDETKGMDKLRERIEDMKR